MRTIPKLFATAVIGGGLGMAALTGVASAQTGPPGPPGPTGPGGPTGPSGPGGTTVTTTATNLFPSVGSNTTGSLPATGTNDLVLLVGAGLLTGGAVVTRRVVGARRN